MFNDLKTQNGVPMKGRGNSSASSRRGRRHSAGTGGYYHAEELSAREGAHRARGREGDEEPARKRGGAPLGQDAGRQAGRAARYALAVDTSRAK